MGKTTIRTGLITGLAACLGLAALAGCGSSGGTTTVIKKTAGTKTVTQAAVQAPKTVTTTTAAKPSPTPNAPAPTETPSGSPPNVEGLSLPKAKQLLSQAGFKPDVSNTDTMLGIIVPENYTVCRESSPRGSIVPILAQKYGCN